MCVVERYTDPVSSSFLVTVCADSLWFTNKHLIVQNHYKVTQVQFKTGR